MALHKLVMNPPPSSKSEPDIGTWFGLLVTAPGRVVTLTSPFPPDEVLHRLRGAPGSRVLKPGQVMIRLPIKGNSRRLFLWLEPGMQDNTRLRGQLQTPYRVAFIRLLCSGLLLFVGMSFMAYARVWLGGLLIAGAMGFLLLSQYERVTERITGRDLRLHLEWLASTLDAHVDK